MAKSAEKTIRRYLDRHAHSTPERDCLPAPDRALRASVVIPAYDEFEHLGEVLASLGAASERPEVFEVIVVVNNGVDAPQKIEAANRATIEFLATLETPFALHVVDRSSPGRAYDPEVAGVGLARREGADLALARLLAVGQAEGGLMPCLDGDSPVAPGYIDQLIREFDARPEMLAGVCRYRHPIPRDQSPESARHARAIIAYEAWMRVYEAEMLLICSPYAFQSIGSCMVLTARGYAQADGMPVRQALSDFYILEKVVKTGGRGAVRQLEGPLVYPSARPSERVPRGTGPSVRMQIETGTSRFEQVEPPQAFFALAELFRAVHDGFRRPEALRDALRDPLLADFLARNNAWATFEKLRKNATTAAQFERQFHTWFDNLKIVKFANEYKRERGGVWIFDAARRVFERLGATDSTYRDIADAIPHAPPNEATMADWRGLLEVLRECELRVHRRSTIT
jgi:hypothetical protein